MEATLKSYCIPVLRKQGFKGSFPHFYRDTDSFVALVNFQFFSSSGSFCVNIGYGDPQRKNVFIEPDTASKKLRISQTKERYRLGAVSGGDHWFYFGKTNYGTYRGEPAPTDEIVDTCTHLFLSEAEIWWKNKQELSH